MHLHVLDCFQGNTLILVLFLVLVLLESGINITKSYYIITVTVYKTQGYIEAMSACADLSMSRAVDEVKALLQYIT